VTETTSEQLPDTTVNPDRQVEWESDLLSKRQSQVELKHYFSYNHAPLIRETRIYAGMNELLAEGLQLMGVGMGVVFLFLGLLVGVITLVSSMIQKSEAATSPFGMDSLSEEDLRAIFTKAVKRYRADHRK